MTSLPVAGGAYVFVLTVMLGLFLMITAVIGVTASSRRISGHYIQFAGIYDLALAGNERAFLLLQREAEGQIETIVERVYQKLYDEGLESHLIYDEGRFLLGNHFNTLFRQEKRGLIDDFLTHSLERRQLQYFYFFYSLEVATGTYNVETRINSIPGGYRVRSTADKGGTSTWVYGQIEWPAFTHQAEIIPTAYAWRGDDPPHWFRVGYYALAGIPGDFFALPLYTWEAENALIIADSLPLGLPDTPTFVIYTGTMPLHISDCFEGIIISYGDVYIEGAHIRGSVISAGQVHLDSYASAQAEPDMIFSIPMTDEARRMVFEFLSLARFSEAGDAEWILGDVKIADFELKVEWAEGFAPQLTRLQRVSN